MIGRALHLAWLDVYAADATCWREAGTHQNMVDAQAHFSPEGVHTVIPPRERVRGLLEQTKAVFEPEREQILKSFAFRRAEQHLPFPRLGVVHIALFGRCLLYTSPSPRD